MGSLLGGQASPIGWAVQYLEALRDVVVAEIVKARAEWGQVVEIASPRPFPEVLHDLLPFEAPATSVAAPHRGGPVPSRDVDSHRRPLVPKRGRRMGVA